MAGAVSPRRESTPWGSITRVNPFAGADKRNLVRRALGFAGFSALAVAGGAAAGGWVRRADAVIAMSPPLTLGVTGRLVAWSHRCPLVFNIQDVFPDAAVATGAIANSRASSPRRRGSSGSSYRLADAVTVLSDDLAGNVARQAARRAQRDKVRTIPNFVDTEAIRPGDRMTAYRAELGIGDEPVVLYAGNVGFSQSLDLVLDAARRAPRRHVPDQRRGLDARRAARRGPPGSPTSGSGASCPTDRLVELLATGDIHVVAAAPRPGARQRAVEDVLDPRRRPARAWPSIDAGTGVPRLLAESGGGVSVAPDDAAAVHRRHRRARRRPERRAGMGAAGRRWVDARRRRRRRGVRSAVGRYELAASA